MSMPVTGCFRDDTRKSWLERRRQKEREGGRERERERREERERERERERETHIANTLGAT